MFTIKKEHRISMQSCAGSKLQEATPIGVSVFQQDPEQGQI